MTQLKGKRILLVTARFFNYEIEIKNRLIELGAHVDWYDQRPSNDFLVKALIRIDNRLLYLKIKSYYGRLIRETRLVEYDYVIFISPETITPDLMERLKIVQKKAIFVLYMWDSMRNKSSSIKLLIHYFDFRFSFDKEDCQNPLYDLTYQPLFFLNEYSQIESPSDRLIDLLFIGTIHSDRFKILMSLKDNCKELGLKHIYYMFFPSKILFMIKWITSINFRKEQSQNFKFSSLSKSEIVKYMTDSKVVLDIQHPKQLGLTMRTIEVLGAGRKLITTNTDIINYDFYCPQNIKIIDRENPKLDMNFFSTPIAPIDELVYKSYSIDGWISSILKFNQ